MKPGGQSVSQWTPRAGVDPAPGGRCSLVLALFPHTPEEEQIPQKKNKKKKGERERGIGGWETFNPKKGVGKP